MLHNNNDRPSSASNTNGSELSDSIVDLKLRTHHGAVDQEALTSRPPTQVFAEVKAALKALGLECKRDGSEYKLKCSRPKRPAEKRVNNSNNYQNGNPPFRMLLRRSSAHQSTVSAATSTTATTTTTTTTTSTITKTDGKVANPTIYGDPNVDPGEEVRFSVELCKIKNLPGLYIVDMRRMRGNVWAYKFIYRTLLDTLKLGGKGGYLNTEKQQQQQQQKQASAEKTVVFNDNANTASNRLSTASSSGGNSSSILDDHPHTPSPPTSTGKEATTATAVVA